MNGELAVKGIDAMNKPILAINVRKVAPTVAVLDIAGDVTGFGEETLMDAYNRATSLGAEAIVLNFSDLQYMNSSGIGLLVTLLIRAQRNNQHLRAFGLNEHYENIFDLTRLNEVIAIHATEQQALATGGG
jgi:anti-sigma B factor antagonist